MGERAPLEDGADVGAPLPSAGIADQAPLDTSAILATLDDVGDRPELGDAGDVAELRDRGSMAAGGETKAEAVRRVLAETGGNQSETARRLNVSRATVQAVLAADKRRDGGRRGRPPREPAAAERDGAPRGTVTGRSYRSVKSKEALRTMLSEKDSRIKHLEQQAAQASTVQAQQVTGQLDQSFGMLLDFAFDTIATTRGAHWKLPADRREKIAAPLALAVGPHMGAVAEYMPALVAVAGIGTHVLAALQEDKRQAEQSAPAPATVGLIIAADR